MSPHRRTLAELEAIQAQSKVASNEAQRTLAEAEDNQEQVTNFAAWLRARRIDNHFSRDYEITARARTT